MKLGRLNHIGIATPSIERSVALYRDLLSATEITRQAAGKPVEET